MQATLHSHMSSNIRPLYSSTDEGMCNEEGNISNKSLKELLLPIDSCNVNQMSGTDLGKFVMNIS
jgi:hypothetical protein